MHRKTTRKISDNEWMRLYIIDNLFYGHYMFILDQKILIEFISKNVYFSKNNTLE